MGKNFTGDFIKDMAIDREDLEGEWVYQPALAMQYSEEYVEALDYRDKLKRKLDFLHAELSLDIRKNPSNYGFESKPAEGAIKAKVETHKKYVKACDRHAKACKTHNSLLEVKKHFEHTRKAALSNLVSLRITGVHSEPRNKVRDLKRQEDIVTNNEHKKKLEKRRKKKKKKSEK